MGMLQYLMYSAEGDTLIRQHRSENDLPFMVHAPRGEDAVTVLSIHFPTIVSIDNDRAAEIGKLLAAELKVTTATQRREFSIVESHYADDLSKVVQEMLRDGWRLAGNAYATVIDDKEWHYQPMTRGRV